MAFGVPATTDTCGCWYYLTKNYLMRWQCHALSMGKKEVQVGDFSPLLPNKLSIETGDNELVVLAPGWLAKFSQPWWWSYMRILKLTKILVFFQMFDGQVNYHLHWEFPVVPALGRWNILPILFSPHADSQADISRGQSRKKLHKALKIIMVIMAGSPTLRKAWSYLCSEVRKCSNRIIYFVQSQSFLLTQY